MMFHLLQSEQSFTIMLDPSGDAKNTGREIGDSFERAITLQCAQELKKQLMDQCPDVRVILTRTAGETLQPFHNASFSNRLGVNFYLNLSFYYEEEMPLHIAIFYYKEQLSDIDFHYNPLQIYHVSQAYLINFNLTQQIAKNFYQTLQQKSLNSAFVMLGLFGVPCSRLVGIIAPALYIEVGFRNKDDWKYLIKPLLCSIQSIIL